VLSTSPISNAYLSRTITSADKTLWSMANCAKPFKKCARSSFLPHRETHGFDAAPKQVRFPWDLAAHIRAMADREFRTIEYQILHLVIQGIRYEELLAEENQTSGKGDADNISTS
jgi:hypothetical protein